ncbi:MAG: outer membrane beta-barrel protein [Bacteroidia bacterium]|nr:outer membrane beta-barrel protein [Bacteroidia bacterium]
MKSLRVILLAIFIMIFPELSAQDAFQERKNPDSLNQEKEEKAEITVGGYVDAYYGYNFAQPEGSVPYFVSMARHNEVNINLAFVDVRYTSPNVRARFAPGFGTYMNANYANEEGVLKNLLEASVGVRLVKNIWLDAGILPSPYTNEGPISKDQLMYTRSFAPEYVPYYLAGARLGIPWVKK